MGSGVREVFEPLANHRVERSGAERSSGLDRTTTQVLLLALITRRRNDPRTRHELVRDSTRCTERAMLSYLATVIDSQACHREGQAE